MKNALIVTTVASTIDQFILPNILLLQDMGFHVSVACNFESGNTYSGEQLASFLEKLNKLSVSYYQIDFPRSLSNPATIVRAFCQLRRLTSGVAFDLVHCHTPVASALCRLACRQARRRRAKVVYTAHGFHFFKGAPAKNYFYYLAEKLCARYTDTIITINQEDFDSARKFKSKQVVRLNGVGVDLSRFSGGEHANRFLDVCGFTSILPAAPIVISVGEINDNKNYECVIRALDCMKRKDVHYILCGQGYLEGELKQLAVSLDLEKRVHFLGYTSDIPDLLAASDIFVSSSLREGLPVSVIEALASGLPVVCSDIRGNRDLIEQNKNGIRCSVNDFRAFADAIEYLLDNKELAEAMSINNRTCAKQYAVEPVMQELKKIYCDVLGR